MKKYILSILILLAFVLQAHAQSGEIFTSGRTTEGIIVQDEGATIAVAPYLNFTGAGVSAATTGGKMVVTISGSSDDSITAVGNCTSGSCLTTGGTITVDTITVDTILTNNLTFGNSEGVPVTLNFNADGGVDGQIDYNPTEDAFIFENVVKFLSDAAPGVDTAGDFAFDNNAWTSSLGAFMGFDGARTVYFIAVDASDAFSNGQIPKINNGIITWEDDDNSAAITCADTGIIFADGEDNPACDVTGLSYNKTTNTITADSFQANPSATPSSDFYDSDVGSGARSAQIAVNCPITTASNEDCQMVFSHQVDGATVDTIIMSADGGVTLDTVVITTSFSASDLVGHDSIKDEDQSDTKCIYIEDPTADDDLVSIWANKTANDFLITELWCESDQTIDWDLQIDDGSPADVNGADIQCAAGEAEDTSLGGDTTLAAGEELDLVVTSVASTPTYVTICWTGNWVD